MRWRQRMARVLAPLLACTVVLSSCMRMGPGMYGTGQIASFGEYDGAEREGIWVYFQEDGTIKRDIAHPTQGLLWRTGFYDDGVKTRELTEAEFRQGLAGARKSAKQWGARVILSDKLLLHDFRSP